MLFSLQTTTVYYFVSVEVTVVIICFNVKASPAYSTNVMTQRKVTYIFNRSILSAQNELPSKPTSLLGHGTSPSDSASANSSAPWSGIHNGHSGPTTTRFCTFFSGLQILSLPSTDYCESQADVSDTSLGTVPSCFWVSLDYFSVSIYLCLMGLGGFL